MPYTIRSSVEALVLAKHLQLRRQQHENMAAAICRTQCQTLAIMAVPHRSTPSLDYSSLASAGFPHKSGRDLVAIQQEACRRGYRGKETALGPKVCRKRTGTVPDENTDEEGPSSRFGSLGPQFVHRRRARVPWKAVPLGDFGENPNSFFPLGQDRARPREVLNGKGTRGSAP